MATSGWVNGNNSYFDETEFTNEINTVAERNVLYASERGTLTDALLIEGIALKDNVNRPMRVSRTGGTANLPTNCSWGVREVLPSADQFMTVRITGCTSAGVAAVWLNALNSGSWTGWVQL